MCLIHSRQIVALDPWSDPLDRHVGVRADVIRGMPVGIPAWQAERLLHGALDKVRHLSRSPLGLQPRGFFPGCGGACGAGPGGPEGTPRPEGLRNKSDGRGTRAANSNSERYWLMAAHQYYWNVPCQSTSKNACRLQKRQPDCLKTARCRCGSTT